MTKLPSNEADNSYILRHESYMLAQFNLVVSTVSIKEAVQLQVGQGETAAAQDYTPQLNAPIQVIGH
jgi:hypothetical protein